MNVNFPLLTDQPRHPHIPLLPPGNVMSETCTVWDGALERDGQVDGLCWVTSTAEGTGVEAFPIKSHGQEPEKFRVSAHGHLTAIRSARQK